MERMGKGVQANDFEERKNATGVGGKRQRK